MIKTKQISRAFPNQRRLLQETARLLTALDPQVALPVLAFAVPPNRKYPTSMSTLNTAREQWNIDFYDIYDF